MNIDQLNYVIEVAKTKSLSAASHNLHVTQSAISQSIANLEAELGIQLFNRSRSGAIPTQEGQSVIRKALEVVSKVQEMKDEALHWSETHQAELRVAALPHTMSSLIRTVSSFKNDYPNVTIRIIESGSEEIIEAIRKNKVDIGLIGISKEANNKETGLAFEALWEGKFVLGVGRNCALSSRNSVTPVEMQRHSFALYDEEHIVEFVNKFIADYGPLHILFTSNNPHAVATALRENLAVTIGYDFSFIDSPYIMSRELVLLEIELMKQEPILLGWAYSETNKGSRISKVFIQRFLNEFQIRNIK
ncbi:LysR family transcriptional regulator [Paenibacillus aceris]|uniref:DNA-binding transcriptional LysR family regulator n=1 Tax=Paenibacillus aceris TaxID=869555 RepID=A0ABS4HXR8_9BACL|nr:LysR family transcriptional regulator [Paenibacillus aceris]MBP1963131.1 DNA-binding transcriptional LysR family regulator [Paenibacillus aceris]NHW38750.1 LysR family transcriptional regulator [Paenibacillus aceris]